MDDLHTYTHTHTRTRAHTAAAMRMGIRVQLVPPTASHGQYHRTFPVAGVVVTRRATRLRVAGTPETVRMALRERRRRVPVAARQRPSLRATVPLDVRLRGWATWLVAGCEHGCWRNKQKGERGQETASP